MVFLVGPQACNREVIRNPALPTFESPSALHPRGSSPGPGFPGAGFVLSSVRQNNGSRISGPVPEPLGCNSTANPASTMRSSVSHTLGRHQSQADFGPRTPPLSPSTKHRTWCLVTELKKVTNPRNVLNLSFKCGSQPQTTTSWLPDATECNTWCCRARTLDAVPNKRCRSYRCELCPLLICVPFLV